MTNTQRANFHVVASPVEAARDAAIQAAERAELVARNILDLADELACQCAELAEQREIIRQLPPALQDGLPRLGRHVRAEHDRMAVAMTGKIR